MEILVQENEELRAKHLEALKNSENLNLSLNTPLNSELLAQLNERVNILMDENALVIEQKVVLANELDAQQKTIEKQAQEMKHLHNRISELSNELSNATRKYNIILQERDEAAKHAVTISDALGKAEQEIESLNEQLLLVKGQYKNLEKEYADLKTHLSSISAKYDLDGSQMIVRVKQMEERVKELHIQLMNKNNEIENNNEVIRKLKAEYASTRHDAEGMLQVRLESLDVLDSAKLLQLSSIVGDD
jgi:uncharacterized coiled-coil DUF342 family protein